MEESEAKPETCGPPPRAYKGASPTPREGKANRQRHRRAMAARARVSGRCARDRSRMAGIRQAEPGSREPGARHRRAGAHSGYATVRVRPVLMMCLLFGLAIRGTQPARCNRGSHFRFRSGTADPGTKQVLVCLVTIDTPRSNLSPYRTWLHRERTGSGLSENVCDDWLSPS